jgi:hypothetical protein
MDDGIEESTPKNICYYKNLERQLMIEWE